MLLSQHCLNTATRLYCVSLLFGSAILTSHLIILKVLKTFQKMLKDVGMAVPKTTATRCRNGSVWARHVIQRLHK